MEIVLVENRLEWRTIRWKLRYKLCISIYPSTVSSNCVKNLYFNWDFFIKKSTRIEFKFGTLIPINCIKTMGFLQVTYSFCKEFLQVLVSHVSPGIQSNPDLICYLYFLNLKLFGKANLKLKMIKRPYGIHSRRWFKRDGRHAPRVREKW